MKGTTLEINGKLFHGRGRPLRPGPCRDRRRDPILNAPGVTVSGENMQAGVRHG